MESLLISFNTPSAGESSENLLRLEQEDWGKHVGVVTKNDALTAILSMVLGNISMPSIDCGLQDDMSMECLIYAYPALPSLPYRLIPSYGSVRRSVRDDLDESEGIVFNSSYEASMNNYEDSVVSYEWINSVFDINGAITSPPNVSFDGYKVILDKPVNGVLVINCNVVRDTWILKVLPRNTTNKKYSSVVIGLYNNGITWVEVTPPPNADNLSDSVNCGWGTWGNGSSMSVSSGDTDAGEDGSGRDDVPTNAPKEDRKIKVDYCTQEILSDTAS